MPPRVRNTPKSEAKTNADALAAAYSGEEYQPVDEVAEQILQNEAAAEASFGGSDDDFFDADVAGNSESTGESDPVEDGALEIPDAVLTEHVRASGNVGSLSFEEVDSVDNSRSSSAGQKYAPAVAAAVQSLLAGRKGTIRVNAEPGKSLSQVVQTIKNVFGAGEDTPNGHIVISARSKRNHAAEKGTVDLYIVASWADGARIG